MPEVCVLVGTALEAVPSDPQRLTAVSVWPVETEGVGPPPTAFSLADYLR